MKGFFFFLSSSSSSLPPSLQVAVVSVNKRKCPRSAEERRRFPPGLIIALVNRGGRIRHLTRSTHPTPPVLILSTHNSATLPPPFYPSSHGVMHTRPSANQTDPTAPNTQADDGVRRRIASPVAPILLRQSVPGFLFPTGTFAQQWQLLHPSVNNISGVWRRYPPLPPDLTPALLQHAHTADEWCCWRLWGGAER